MVTSVSNHHQLARRRHLRYLGLHCCTHTYRHFTHSRHDTNSCKTESNAQYRATGNTSSQHKARAILEQKKVEIQRCRHNTYIVLSSTHSLFSPLCYILRFTLPEPVCSVLFMACHRASRISRSLSQSCRRVILIVSSSLVAVVVVVSVSSSWSQVSSHCVVPICHYLYYCILPPLPRRPCHHPYHPPLFYYN